MSVGEGQDGPIQDVVKDAAAARAKGAVIFQKFTCGKCGARQTMPEPNVFYAGGTCEECGHTTELKTCGFMAVFGDKEMQSIIINAMRGGDAG